MALVVIIGVFFTMWIFLTILHSFDGITIGCIICIGWAVNIIRDGYGVIVYRLIFILFINGFIIIMFIITVILIMNGFIVIMWVFGEIIRDDYIIILYILKLILLTA